MTRKRLRSLLVISIIIVLAVFIMLAIAGYWFQWSWTGLPEHIGPKTPQSQQYQPAKTAWDWLQLLGTLAIPVVVGFGVAWFTTKQTKVSNAENKDNQRDAALQAYIDKMSELLLEKNLRGSSPGDEVRNIARARTLTVLRQLDSERKAYVLKFLYESHLIDKGGQIVDLHEADLSGAYLVYANLSGADLGGAYLSEADLSLANLKDTNLSNTSLIWAELVKTNLTNANLRGASLECVQAYEAILKNADLRETTLMHAKLLSADLSNAQIRNVIAEDADFTDAVLTDTKFANVIVTNAKFDGTEFSDLIKVLSGEVLDRV